jgi:hypothetical protein
VQAKQQIKQDLKLVSTEQYTFHHNHGYATDKAKRTEAAGNEQHL